jgi:hypothetical protein
MVRIQFRRRGGPATATVNKLGLSLFFLFFFGIGSLFELLLLHEFIRVTGQQAWKKTPCTIVAAEVQERQEGDEPYVFTVRYQYEYEGQACEGTGYRRGYDGSGEYSKAQELAEKYPVGLATSCYVNPENLSEAVLERDSMLIGLVLFFPLIFVLIGAGGLYFTWRRRPPEEAMPIAPAGASVARAKGLGRFGLAAFFSIFAIVGGVMLYFLSVKPIARTLAAESWVETPCRVLRAEVRDHDSDDGTTYSVYILYEYEFDGRTYKSDRYDFMAGSSSGYKDKARVVQAYLSAERPVCYVNPQNPSEAVLKRGFHAKLLLALFPLPFLLVGVGGLIGTLRRKKPASGGASIGPMGPMGQMGLTGPADGTQVLRPTHSPRMKFIGITIVACFWNGIVSIFVVGMIRDLSHGGRDLFGLLFMLPFVAVGLGLIGGAVYLFLAMFNPRPMLELSSGSIPLGGAAELRWTFSGQTGRIGELFVTLRGVEEARYRRGTNTCTDRNTFFEMELHKTSDAYEIASGRIGFVVPPDTMHSFEAANNKILWSLEVHGSIKGWPDVKESFKINVVPTVA